MPQRRAARHPFREVFGSEKHLPPLGQVFHLLTGDSQHSQDSRAMHAPYDLNDLEIDLFEERAAIMEFDAGLPREVAEFKALLAVLARRL